MKEQGKGNVVHDASILRGTGIVERGKPCGVYTVRCIDPDGKLKWKDKAKNVVTDVGANQLLDSAFGSGPVAGPFLSLISSVGYTGIPVVADTMGSHASGGHVWVEAGNGANNPTWTTPAANARRTITFATAGSRSKALSAVATFVINTGGTVKGCFIVFGTGAVATNNDLNGVLYSAGVFGTGDKVVGTGDTLQVSYSTAI